MADPEIDAIEDLIKMQVQKMTEQHPGRPNYVKAELLIRALEMDAAPYVLNGMLKAIIIGHANGADDALKLRLQILEHNNAQELIIADANRLRYASATLNNLNDILYKYTGNVISLPIEEMKARIEQALKNIGPIDHTKFKPDRSWIIDRLTRIRVAVNEYFDRTGNNLPRLQDIVNAALKELEDGQ